MGRCGRPNMLRPYLKIWDWDWIFGRAVRCIFSLGVSSPCLKRNLLIVLELVFVITVCFTFEIILPLKIFGAPKELTNLSKGLFSFDAGMYYNFIKKILANDVKKLLRLGNKWMFPHLKNPRQLTCIFLASVLPMAWLKALICEMLKNIVY